MLGLGAFPFRIDLPGERDDAGGDTVFHVVVQVTNERPVYLRMMFLAESITETLSSLKFGMSALGPLASGLLLVTVSIGPVMGRSRPKPDSRASASARSYSIAD
jgi:hypothetical protein